MNAHRLLFATLAAGAVAGCYLSTGDAPGSSGGGSPSTSPSPSGGGTTTATDLPCDVASVLQAKCTSCHSSPPVGGAPMSLVSYADLTAQDLSDKTKTVAEQCVVRMQSSTAPMPPGGGATSSDVQTIQNWISAGYPQGSCGGSGGSTTDYNTPVVCTSGVTNSSSELDSRMHPGGACNGCHSTQGGEAPQFQIAGTVYPTAHEPNDCFGVGSGAAQIVIMDASGNVQLTLSTNSSGNFSSQASISKPYRAKVVANGKERAMSATQTSGDCNSCHTESGANGAPGRIMLPN
jgi:cytochrome c553